MYKKRIMEEISIMDEEFEPFDIANYNEQQLIDEDKRSFIIKIPEKVINLILKNKEIDAIEYNGVIWVRDIVETLYQVTFNHYLVRGLITSNPEFKPYIFEVKILSTENKKNTLVKLFTDAANNNQNVIYQISNTFGTEFSLVQLSGDNYVQHMSANLPESEQLKKHSFLEITTTKVNGFNLANDLVQNINDIAEYLVNTGYNEFNDIIYLGDDIADFDLVFELRTKFVTGKYNSLNQFRSNSMVQLTGYLTQEQVEELKGSNLWSRPVYSTYVLKSDYYKGKHAK
jgi:hypothetical protein